jgi:hypothetical protein
VLALAKRALFQDALKVGLGEYRHRLLLITEIAQNFERVRKAHFFLYMCKSFFRRGVKRDCIAESIVAGMKAESMSTAVTTVIAVPKASKVNRMPFTTYSAIIIRMPGYAMKLV